jgi:hypothetical protein
MTKQDTKEDRELTFGERAVGITFNPSGDENVNKIKEAFANVIDIMHELRSATGSGERKRMYSLAINDAQTAQMWAVKSCTWQD